MQQWAMTATTARYLREKMWEAGTGAGGMTEQLGAQPVLSDCSGSVPRTTWRLMTLGHSSLRASGVFFWPLGISQTIVFLFLFFYKSLHRLVPVMSEDADLYIAEFHAGSISMLENENVCQVRIFCYPYTPRVSIFLVRVFKMLSKLGSYVNF